MTLFVQMDSSAMDVCYGGEGLVSESLFYLQYYTYTVSVSL